MKTKWQKNKVPAEEGWYWCKYKGKHGRVICPCHVMYFGNPEKIEFAVHTARNDSYNSNNAETFGAIWFGPKIEEPS